MRRDLAVSINYPRHFLLLAIVTAILILTHRRLPAIGVLPSLGLYGVLHSSVLAASLRPPRFEWRKLFFVAAASGLAMLSVVMARLGSQAFAALPGMAPPALLLTLSSGLGAMSYCLLIRRLWIRDLSRRTLNWITLCCATATLLALPLGSYLHTVGGWWFVIIWWWAFSLALWHHDRVYRIEVPHVWHS